MVCPYTYVANVHDEPESLHINECDLECIAMLHNCTEHQLGALLIPTAKELNT